MKQNHLQPLFYTELSSFVKSGEEKKGRKLAVMNDLADGIVEPIL